MSDTQRREPPVWFRKEKKAFRHPHLVAARHAANIAVRVGRDPEPYRRTSGWLTH